MYIKAVKLSKNEVDVLCVDSEGFSVCENINSKEARSLAIDMMDAAKKLLELSED